MIRSTRVQAGLRGTSWRAACVLASAIVSVGLLSGPAAAGTLNAVSRGTAAGTISHGIAAGAKGTPGSARLANPEAVLPAGWQHSADEAVTVVGDATGLHVLAASEASGYTWRSVATLGDPAVETSLWIGQACVTASGRYAVVVYAPQQVTNMAGAQGVLARAAIVNLDTGAVTDLGGGFSIAYFDPGCGTGNQAVLTKGGWADDTSNAPLSSTLAVVNAATGGISSTVQVPGQITSAVPYAAQIVAAGGAGVEEITRTGKTRLLAATPTVPFRLTPDASGGLGYQTVAGEQVRLWRLAGGHARQVASVTRGSVELSQVGGRVWLTGPDASKIRGLPRQWHAVDAPVTSQLSTTGTLAVTVAESSAPAPGRQPSPYSAEPVAVRALLLGGSRGSESFEVPTSAGFPAAGGGPTPSAPEGATGEASSPVSGDRTCAVPINDPRIQAYQPTFQQVEWAADQAVQGALTNTRPAGLYGSSLPSYKPQRMFPLPSVAGGGSLPAQVMLGVLAQESNLQQASRHVIQGQTSNPLTSFNWYGNWVNGGRTNTGRVDWANADCGYGIAQVTTGMCLSKGRNHDPECAYHAALPFEQQLAIAVDYEANIAKGAQLLIGAFNQLWHDGIKPDGHTQSFGVSSNPRFIDNWYMAVWAYNSGLEPASAALGNTTGCTPGPSCTDRNKDWGLGYADNPINPAYPPDRPTFPDSSPNGYPAPGGATYSQHWDLSHPQYWPYQEKVLAFAYDSVALFDYSKGRFVQAFAFAHGTYTPPPFDLFCTSADHCNAGKVNVTKATGPDACQLTSRYADHCWWHVEPNSEFWPITAPTITCSDCGLGVLTYRKGAAAPKPEPIAAQFRETCNKSPLPSNAVIVGNNTPAALGCPGKNWTSAGPLTWTFARARNGTYPSKILFDQIGAGFGGHFWFGYDRPSNRASESSITPAPAYADQVITGTWTPPRSVTGWTRIMVAIPSYGADSPEANYQVATGGGRPTWNVQVNQGAVAGNAWVDLGDFFLGRGAHVSLSNVTASGQGVDIAWDAAAFIPRVTPRLNYVAMGDSYSAGEGVSPYYPGTDTSKNTCHRSTRAYATMVTLPGQREPIARQNPHGFSFIACSGAETTGVTNAAVNPVLSPKPVYAVNARENQFNRSWNTDWGYVQNASPWASNGGPVEGFQAANSALTDRTALITISIGGNDSRFGDVLIGCLLAALKRGDCASAGYTLTRHSTKKTDPTPLKVMEQTVIRYLTAHLVQTYLAINFKAPSAEIIVVGYPLLFPERPASKCDPGSILGKTAKISPAAQIMLNLFGNKLAAAISQAVSQARHDGVGIRYIDPRAAFSGHALCSRDPWILPISVGKNKSSSFHPNLAGQQAFGRLVNECLAGTLPC
jgi:GDSL-like Lipase/Acylhydrolase family